jgi:hypothetical protein
VRAFVEAVRFPANGGRRGVHGNPTAARIWGVTADEYAEKADVWPLNPKGELLLGLKLEDKYALENAEANAKIPGVAFAEWGPGDMAFSLGVKSGARLGERSADEGGARAGPRRHQSQQDLLPQLDERRQRRRHDQGRRHGSARPASRPPRSAGSSRSGRCLGSDALANGARAEAALGYQLSAFSADS